MHHENKQEVVYSFLSIYIRFSCKTFVFVRHYNLPVMLSHTHMHTHPHTRARTHTHTHINTYAHIYLHTNKHTYLQYTHARTHIMKIYSSFYLNFIIMYLHKSTRIQYINSNICMGSVIVKLRLWNPSQCLLISTQPLWNVVTRVCPIVITLFLLFNTCRLACRRRRYQRKGIKTRYTDIAHSTQEMCCSFYW